MINLSICRSLHLLMHQPIIQSMHLPSHLPQLQALLNNYFHASYKPSSKPDIQAVSRQLTRFTKSNAFMDTAFYMLSHCQCDRDRTVLLTTLIKDKFKYDFESIPIDRLKDYYNQLCQFAFKIFSISMETVQRQICQSLAYLFINFTSLQPVTIDQFLQPFDKGEDDHLYNCYFQVLTEIAMELDNNKLVLDDFSRENVKKQILERQASILALLNEVADRFWQNENINNQTLVYCFTAWVALDNSPAVFNSLPGHAMMPKLFSLLYDFDGSECALDCLDRIIRLTQRGPDYAPIIGYLGYNIVNLLPFIEELIAKLEDSDAEAYIDLVLCFCKSAVEYFVNFGPQSLSFINKIAGFTKNNKGIFEDYCKFWETYLEELDRKVNFGETRVCIGYEAEDLLENINRALCSQCRYSNYLVDYFDTQSEHRVIKEHSKAQEIHKRRKKAKELFGILAKILTYQQYVNKTCNKIRELQQSSNSFWADLEVLLFSLGFPLKDLNFINQDINMLVNTYIELIQHPHFKTPILVKRAFLKLFRSLMSNKVKNATMAKKLFYYNSISFDNDLLAEEADRTFCKGCEYNAELMVPDIDSFVAMIKLYPHRQNITSGVVHIICCSVDTIRSHLIPTLVFLRETVEAQERKTSRRKDCMNSMISAFKILKDNSIIQRNKAVVKQFVRQSLPFFLKELTCADCPKQDQNTEIERAVKAIKYLMRCLRSEFWQFVETIFHHVLQAFKTYPVSSYVYLMEIAVTVFSNRPSYQEQEEILVNIYSNFCQQSFIHLCNNQSSDRLSFLLDDFLGLSKRFFIHNPSIVINSNQLAPLIDHSLQYIGCDTPRVAKAAYTFFQVIFMAYWRQYFIDQYNKDQNHDPLCFNCNDYEIYNGLKMELQDKIHYILAKMLKHLSQIPSETIESCILDTIVAELKAFPQWNGEIWEKLILPLPNDIFRGTEKSQFMNCIEQTNEKDDYVVERAINSLQVLLKLMSKRMYSAFKRKIIELK